MQVLLYDGLDPTKINGFKKFSQALARDDFFQADVKKVGDNLYRARLNQRDRLLFSLYRYQGVQYCLALEYIPNHDYNKSRFLTGARVDDDKIPQIIELSDVDSPELVYLNRGNERFHLLDKVLSFDDAQQEIYLTPAPVVIIGSAGSGKTALMLEKMKQGIGDVLYVSHSPYLVQNSHQLYYAHEYNNELQDQVDFLSFREYLETIEVPEGREVTRSDFEGWFSRHRVGGNDIKDAHKLFEEFRGVLTGPAIDTPYLSREDYRNLGVRQSLFAGDVREQVYGLFEKYLDFLQTNKLYDCNIISQQYLTRVTPQYDFVVVDEVQDLTNIQLLLILKSLRLAGEFVLCGDANQIVHPNFFSWSKLKSLFFEQEGLVSAQDALHILHANYRNASLITNVANRILKLKHARFGSVDKESNFLVKSVGKQQGSLQLLESHPSVIQKLDASTARSTKFAVVVLHQEQKAQASKLFNTPLVFSIQEAKGLEYDSIILYNFVSGEEKAYREIARGVDASLLDVDSLVYARAKSKVDKSLEIYKFYINSFYVAITRAVCNLYIIEDVLSHPLLTLLDLTRFTGELSIDAQQSTQEEWQQEARRLELQGKQEQAQAIRSRILSEKPVPWQSLTTDKWGELRHNAAKNDKKSRLLAMEYALLHQDIPMLVSLAEADFKPALQILTQPLLEQKAVKTLYKNRFMLYDMKHPAGILREVNQYGVNHRTIFNMTPLMQAAIIGNATAVQLIADRGADNNLLTNHGLNAWQLALGRAFKDKKYAQNLSEIHKLLAPDAISVQVDGKLEKLDEHSMYGFLVNVFFSLWYQHTGQKISEGCGITAASLCELLEMLPDKVLSPMKKKRSYISRYLSENEVDRNTSGSKKLYKRIKRGQYVLNPQLKIRVEDEWKNLHTVLSFDGWGYIPDHLNYNKLEVEYRWAKDNVKRNQRNIAWFKEFCDANKLVAT